MRQLETVRSAVPPHVSHMRSHKTPPTWVTPSGCFGRPSSGWSTVQFSVEFEVAFTSTAIAHVRQEVNETLEREGWKQARTPWTLGPNTWGDETWGDGWSKRLSDGKLARLTLIGSAGADTRVVGWSLRAIAPPAGDEVRCAGGG